MTCRSTRTSLRVLAAAILPIALIAVVPHAAQANRSNYPTNEVVAGTASIGAAHVCYIVSGGTVKCWGFNRDGQLGNGTGGFGTDVAQGSDTTVSGITNAVAVSAGLFNTCALLSDGTIKCWGSRMGGALGDGLFTGQSNTPVAVQGITTAIGVEVRNYGACAVLQDGSVKCWGRNNEGAVGNGSVSTAIATPAAVPGITSALRMASSSNSGNVSCVVTDAATSADADNELWCWGNNFYGQLADGTQAGTYNTPRRITTDGTTPLTGVVSSSTGDSSTCAVLHTGSVMCWGSENGGRLGNGSTTVGSYQFYPTPVQAASNTPLTNVVAIASSQANTCAMRLVSGAKSQVCWGAVGPAGNRGFADFVPTFTGGPTASDVAHIMGALRVSAFSGIGYSWCAIMVDMSLRCAGTDSLATGLSAATHGLTRTPTAPPPAQPAQTSSTSTTAPASTTTAAPTTIAAPTTTAPATATAAPSTTTLPVRPLRATDTQPELPETGNDSPWLMTVAVLLLGFGVVVTRTRRSRV